MNKVISLDNVWKKYRLGQTKSLAELVQNFVEKKKRSEFWALKNINFTVARGETLGIIGQNGSGKSTILKILSGITNPTIGNVSSIGKLASLLELGTSFHPELTGRENIYLYGALLGLTHHQVRDQLSEILEFSGIHHFIDTPLKHYSTGMQARLAFSTAISVDPDILLVDEVLAVGDLEFQDKCFMYLESMKKNGKTIIFVSHAMSVVQRLCDRAILLEGGEIVKKSLPIPVINQYVGSIPMQKGRKLTRWGDKKAQVVNAWIERSHPNGLVIIKVKIKFNTDSDNPIFGIIIRSQRGISIFESNTKWLKIYTGNIKKGETRIISWKIQNIFDTGKYSISPAVAYQDEIKMYDWRDNFIWMNIKKTYVTGGVINCPHEITITKTG